MSTVKEPVLITLSDVQPEKVRWLWVDRVPIGKTTIFAGDPGVGKSFVALDLAARVSTGGHNITSVGDVILLSAEDDPADTIRPRLISAGANASRIHLLKAVREDGSDKKKERMLRLDRDIEQITETIRRCPETLLIIIDPLSAYMVSTDSRSDEQVRAILTPLSQLAAENGVAIVCIKHLNKAEEKSAIYRAGGSIAFIAAVRVAWMFAKDQNDPDRRFMIQIKSNISANPGTLAYSIQQTESGSSVKWESETVDVTLENIFRPAEMRQGRVKKNAEDWLTELLSKGAMAAKDVQEKAAQVGLSWATVRRASEELGVQSIREGFGPEGQWKWALP
jgi:RecA-family ATPase